MKKLRISSPLNMHAYPREDISEFIRQGLLFNKKAGFDATDFSVTLVDVTRDNWQTVVEKAELIGKGFIVRSAEKRSSADIGNPCGNIYAIEIL